MVKEVWRDIKNFEGFYKISNMGKVKSMPRNGTIKQERILVPGRDKDGYLRVVLNKKGFKRYVRIHTLVAENFLDNPNFLLQIDHIDGNKENNSVNNLRYCTGKINCNNPNTLKKLCKKVMQINKGNVVVNIYNSTRDAERKTGISHVSIVNCCNLKANSAGGFYWEYVEEMG